jgi:hypothetical protein
VADQAAQGVDQLRERVRALSEALAELMGAVETTLPDDSRGGAMSERLTGAREVLAERRRVEAAAEGAEPIAAALMRGDRVWTALRECESGSESLLTLAALSDDDLRGALLSRLWQENSARLPSEEFSRWSGELREFVGWSAEEDPGQSPSS